MAWMSTGRPMVRQQRERVVRVDGIDTDTIKDRPRQLGTYTSQRAARRAVADLLELGDVESAVRAEKGTVARVHRLLGGRQVDVSAKSRQQYDWAASHIRKGLGGIPLDQLTREDVATWIDDMAAGGVYARRSIHIFRMVLRATLDEAVAEGRLRRSPAARSACPARSSSRTGCARCRRGPRTTSAGSSPRSRSTAGTARSASTSSTASAAASSSASSAATST